MKDNTVEEIINNSLVDVQTQRLYNDYLEWLDAMGWLDVLDAGRGKSIFEFLVMRPNSQVKQSNEYCLVDYLEYLFEGGWDSIEAQFYNKPKEKFIREAIEQYKQSKEVEQ